MENDAGTSLSLGLRTLAKPVAVGAVAVVMISQSVLLGTLLGVMLLGMAFSWLALIGMDCSNRSFFPSRTLNDIIGTVALAPMLQRLRGDGTPSPSLRERGRALVADVFGLSLPHAAVDVFLFFVVPLVIMRVGWLFVLKYWVLPLVIANVNVMALTTASSDATKPHASSLSSSSVLFPELREVLEGVPLYSVAERVARGKEMLRARVASGWPVWWPLAQPTREVLLWRSRDWALLGALVLCCTLMAVGTSVPLWLAPLALLLPLLAWKSRASLALQQRSAGPRPVSVAPLPIVSRAELRTRTDWIAVRGIVVDVVRFADVHPGGDHIRAFGGTDCSAAFASMHGLPSDAHAELLRRHYAVAQLAADDKGDGSVYAPQCDSPFALDLLRSMANEMRGTSPYAPWQWWVRTALIAAATLACEWWWATRAALPAMVAVGVLHALIGVCVQHDASHGAVSSNASLNAFVSYGADWIGGNRWLWYQQHVIGHHPHCNVEGADPDAHSAEPLLYFMRVAGVQRWFARYQWLYMYAVLMWHGPSVIYDLPTLLAMNHGNEAPPNAWVRARLPGALALRAFYIARIIVAPLLLAPQRPSLLLALLGVPLVVGGMLTFLFVVSHNFEGSDRAPATADVVDFYRLQVETSCSYGGALAGALTGGLNMQIEHHVLPRLNSWYYPRISGVVRDACKRHGVRYTHYDSLWQNIVSTVRYMRSTGQQVADAAVAAPPAAAPAPPVQILIDGKRLDVTRWAARHPGGSEVFAHFAERDAIEQFTAMHTPAAQRQLAAMMRSAPDAPTPSPLASDAVALAFRKLRADCERDGLFEVSPLTEALRMALLLSFYASGVVALCNGWHWLGTLLYAWGMQQSGWLSHDYLHHEVFRHSRVWLGDFVGGALGWLQGYDSLWWKNRHNLHHVVTNETGIDPDIDLAPLLTYMDSHARTALPGLRRWQHVYFLPLLSLLHVSWRVSSLRFLAARREWGRLALLGAHYAWMAWLFRDAGVAALVALVLFKGFTTAIFVFSTHYPEVRLPAGAQHMSLVRQTALTSRNITGWAMDYASGNISRQIEHHLFPTMPRANLPVVSERVRAFFAQHGLPYHEAGLAECMLDNMRSLMVKE